MTEDRISESLKRMERRAAISLKHIKEDNDPEKAEAWKRAAEHYTCAAEALKKVRQYMAIGTAEECREGVERQKAKKPDVWGDGCDDEGNTIYDMYGCPNCGKHYEIDYAKHDFCPACGQAIDWRDI